MLATRTPQQRMSNKRATATANVAKPASLPSGLHRAAGNQAAQRQLESRLVQAKLSVNQPGDKFELEADRVADQVMRMPDPSRDGPPRIQRVCTHCQNEMGAARVQRVCRECEEELHRKAGDGARDTPAVSGHLESQIASLRGGGQPLLPSTRSFFERRFGRDFSDVRVHASGRAAETACSVNALAYTAGRDIVFAPAQYSPETERGKRLLAHELSHTVQQGQARESSAPAVQRMGDPAKVPAGLACPVASDSPPTSIVEVLFPNSVTVLTAAQKRAIQSFAVSWNASGASADVRVDGYASPAGTDELNWRLSCERAQAVSVELSTPSAPGIPAVPPSKLSVFAQGETSEFSRTGGADPDGPNRRASISSLSPLPPPPPPGPKPAPVPNDAPSNCVPATGLPPTSCSAYADNAFWLPRAYVNNATCACEETPNSTTANCVRKFLQDRLKSTPQSIKDFWSTEKQLEFFNKGEYDEHLIQVGLTQRIFQDHVDAYSNCCCPSGPAPFPAWIGVTTIPLTCKGVGTAIRQFGSCHGTPGAW